jgi:hydroxysqualene synthase
MTAAAIDLSSGKGHRDENFPVGSFVLRRAVRAPVLAFYRFARAADDVADHESATPADKLRRLAAMRDTLDGVTDSDATALTLRASLKETAVPLTHAHDLLRAFERDVTKLRTDDWDDLIGYCRVSAMPVGRFMLDIHGESRALWAQSDALCAALQIINHLQDCAKDRRALDRVYLPLDIMARHGALLADLDAPAATPALRAVIADLAARCDDLLDEAAGFSAAIADWRLGVEVAVIAALARDLVVLLKGRDPLSQRVHHARARAAWIASGAALRRLVLRR